MRGVLTWDKPTARRKLPAILDMRRIVDRCDSGGGRQGADARNREETMADRIRLTHGFQLPIVIREPLLQREPFFREFLAGQNSLGWP
jgi:hypothetical protein